VAAPVAMALLFSACAPSLSTFQPAHVAPAHTVTVSAGGELGIPTGALDTLIDTGKTLAQRGESGQPLTDQEQLTILDAGINLLLAAPTVGPHFAIGYVPREHIDVDVRYAGGGWRLGGRYQLLSHQKGPFDLTVGLGVSRYTFEVPLGDVIPGLDLSDFSRWQVDVPILVGTSRDWMRVWAGPKILFTSFGADLSLTLPGITPVMASFEGHATFLGGQGGVAFGYRWIFVAFELTVAESFGTAHLTAPGLNPPTHDTSLSSFTVFPAFGIMGEY
jgi:hypothetical protein